MHKNNGKIMVGTKWINIRGNHKVVIDRMASGIFWGEADVSPAIERLLSGIQERRSMLHKATIHTARNRAQDKQLNRLTSDMRGFDFDIASKSIELIKIRF